MNSNMLAFHRTEDEGDMTVNSSTHEYAYYSNLELPQTGPPRRGGQKGQFAPGPLCKGGPTPKYCFKIPAATGICHATATGKVCKKV